MGSLMAGWDSPVLGDENTVRARRNKSLTREEVEAFWKQHGIKLDVDGEMMTTSSPLGSPAAAGSLSRAQLAASPRGVRNIDPAATGVEGFFPDDVDAAAESPSKSHDWWTRSNWAFLNEPPQEEVAGKAQSYKPQFDVARSNA